MRAVKKHWWASAIHARGSGQFFANRKSGRRLGSALPIIERVEDRILFAGWSTVDDVASPPNSVGRFSDMASDAAGDVFAVGTTTDSAGVWHGIVHEKAAGATAWAPLLVQQGNNSDFHFVAVGTSGELYISASNSNGGALYSFTPGQTSAQVIDQMPSAVPYAVTVDSAGNLFVGGVMNETTTTQGPGNKTTSTSANHWFVQERPAGQNTFKTIDDFVANCASSQIYAITCVGSGASESIYEIGTGTFGATHTYVSDAHWIVRKSANAGATWATVDDTYYSDATGSAYGSVATGATVDPAGNIYVAGTVTVETVTGGTARKPVYTTNTYSMVKETSNGGASWTTSAVIANGHPTRVGIGTDAAGNVYLADAETTSGNTHAVVRSNAGGTWNNILDDYQLASGHDTTAFAFARDPAGNFYVAGTATDSVNAPHAFIRSRPAAPTNLAASQDVAAPSSQIDLSWTNAAGSDETGFAIYRSSNGGASFTLAATVGAGITTYSDTGLAAGTTYSYYIVTLLNLDGSSNPSNISSAMTTP